MKASPATLAKSILLTALSVSLLTACGGSGGDTKTPPSNPTPNTNPSVDPKTNSNSLINRPFYRVCADRVEKYLFLDEETLVISKKYSKVNVSNSTLLVEIKGSDITIREDVYSASKPNIEPLTLKNSDSGELVFYFSREKAEKLPAKTCLDPVYGRSGAYEYDSEGRVISSTQTNKNGTSTKGTHTYNKKGEKSSTIVYFDKDGVEKSRRLLSFDLNGNITKKRDIRPDGTFIETRNSYNADDKIVKVTWLKSDGAHGKTDTTYFKNGEIKSKVYFSYNADDEITNQGHRTNNEQGKPLTNNYSYTGGTAYADTYTYYKNGNKKSATLERIYANGKSSISLSEYDTSGKKLKGIITDYNADKTVKSTAEYAYINGREKVISTVETGTNGIKVTRTYSYNSEGNILSKITAKSDGTSSKTLTTYHSNGKKKSEASFTYNSAKEVTSQSLKIYNEQGKTLTDNTSNENGSGRFYTYSYYDNGNTKSSSTKYLSADGSDYVYLTQYDTNKKKTKETRTDHYTDGSVKSTRVYDYDSQGKVSKKVETNSEGVTTTELNTYNADGKILSNTWTKSDGTSGKKLTVYHSNGKKKSEDSFTYNSADEVTYQRHYTYNEQGKVLTDSYTNENGSGRDDAYSYYDNGNKKSSSTKYLSSDGSDYVYLYQYDTNKKKTKETLTYHYTDGSVKSTRVYDYDSQGKITKKIETNSEGVTTTELNTYNAGGKVLSNTWTKSDGTSGKKLTVYHSNGKVKSQDSFTYNSADEVTYQRHYTYNEQGKTLTDSRSSLNGTTYAYTYSYLDNKKKNETYTKTYADGKDRVYLYEYDLNEKKIKETLTYHYADGSVESIQVRNYNDQGKIIKQIATNSEGVITTNLYTYNTAGKQLSDNWSKSDDTHGKVDTTYHSNGNKQSQDRYDYNSANEVTYQRHYIYNEQGKRLTDSYTNADGSGTAYTYSYYANGNDKTYSRIYTSADGSDYSYLHEYDSNEKQTKQTLTYHYADGSVKSIEVKDYNTEGKVTKKVATNSEGVTTTNLYTYNTAGKQLSDNWSKSDGTHGKVDTVYHSNGNKQSQDRYDYNSANEVTYQRHYIYNEQGKRLTDSYTNADGSGTAYTYSYYANGNDKTYSRIYTSADGSDYSYLHEYDSNEKQTKQTLTYHYADGSVKSTRVYTYYTNGQKQTSLEITYDTAGNETGRTSRAWNEDGTEV